MRWNNLAVGVQAYLIANLAFATSVLLVFAYAGVFHPLTGSHPLPCVFTMATGVDCPSCGLSRAFSFIIRGQFSAARALNPHGGPIFLFFLVQLLMRGLTSLYLIRGWMNHQIVLTIDLILAVLLFVLAFYPFFRFWVA